MTGRVVPVGDLPSEGPLTRDLPVPAVALAVGAHPDDVEFGCGALLAKWAAAGCDVHLLVLTDGSKGTWEDSDDTAALVATRHEEQRRAARLLGARAVEFLDWPDGELASGMPQRRQVCEALRRIRPEAVLGHDPWRRYRLHPDHRHAGWLVTDGIVAGRDPKFFEDLGLPAHRPEALLLWEADAPNHVEEVGASVDAKVAALLAHRSQHRSTFGIEDDDPDLSTAVVRAMLVRQLAAHGALVGVAAGEAFRLVSEV